MTKTKMRSVTVSEISVLKPSSHSEDESKEKDPLHLKPPSHPRSKLRTTLDTILTASFDCFLALLAVVFFVFGAFASHSNDQLVDEVPYADALLSAVQLVSALKCRTFITIAPVLTFGQGPTFFPMVFALIAVRLIKAIHRKVASGNKKRDAAQVKVLQQLLDSRTIGDTLVTLAKLRTINLSGMLLVLLWAFSPLGGQASLRIASVETFPWPSNATFSYIDFDTIYSMYTGSSWWIANIDIVKAIYSTSLISSPTPSGNPLRTLGRISKFLPLNSLIHLRTLPCGYRSHQLTKLLGTYTIISTPLWWEFRSPATIPHTTIPSPARRKHPMQPTDSKRSTCISIARILA